MSYPWFRMYSEFAKDPKVQSLDEKLQRRLVMIFCLHCSKELPTLSEDDLAYALAISVQELRKTKLRFTQKGFIDENWEVLNWEKRQFKSDTSTYRTRAYRQRLREKENIETSRERHGNVTVTSWERNGNVLDTDTETEEEKKKLKQKKSVPGKSKAKQTQGEALSVDFYFSKFWEEYPNKVDKKRASIIFKRINPSDKLAEEIITAVQSQKRARASNEKSGGFSPAWKNPTTWLSGECWNDQGVSAFSMSSEISKRVELNAQEIKKLQEQRRQMNAQINNLAIQISSERDEKERHRLFDLKKTYDQEISNIEIQLGREHAIYLND